MSFYIHPAPADLKRALASWSWLDLEGKLPYRITAFGDVFFLDAMKQIWFLDRLEGTIELTFNDVSEMEAVLATEEGQDRYLLGGFVLGARLQGLELANTECYDWRIPPTLGGPIELHNVHKISFVVALNLSGQLHEQLRNLPPGTKLSGFEFEDA